MKLKKFSAPVTKEALDLAAPGAEGWIADPSALGCSAAICILLMYPALRSQASGHFFL